MRHNDRSLRVPHDVSALRVPAVATMAVLSGCYLSSLLSLVLVDRPAEVRVLGMAAVTVVALVQIGHSFPGTVPLLRSVRWQSVMVQAVLGLAVAVAYPGAWTAAPGFLSGSLLLCLSQRFAWWSFGLAVGTLTLVTFRGGDLDDLPFALVASALAGLGLYSLNRMSELLGEAYQSRMELARRAVTEQQHRFARDLHDLLGYSLTTIAVKSKLVRQLMSRDPLGAQRELADIAALANQAARDTREVSHGYRAMSLRAEVSAAESLLESIGVRTTARIAVRTLTSATETVLATVLREGLANMLRHSSAGRCTITVEQDGAEVRFRMSNDHPAKRPDVEQPSAGTGLAGLADRVRELGGRLQVAADGSGWFHLTALVPDAALRYEEQRT